MIPRRSLFIIRQHVIRIRIPGIVWLSFVQFYLMHALILFRLLFFFNSLRPGSGWVDSGPTPSLITGQILIIKI